VKALYLLFLFNRYIIYHSEYKPFEHKGHGKMQCTSPSPTTVRRYIVVPAMSRLYECDMNLQVLGVPTTVGMHQQTYSGEKLYRYQECGNSSVYPGSLCTCSVNHTIRKCFECTQCCKALSSLQRHEKNSSGRRN
jgi:KRAB domain-containing zinc finger protein